MRMKKLLTFLAVAAAFSACSPTPGNHEAAAETEAHDHGSAELIELADEQARRFGVAVDTVRPGEFATVVRCSGVIERSAANLSTASAPKSGVVRFAGGITRGASVGRGAVIASIDASAVSGGDENRVAAAAIEAARKEVERLRPLYEQRLATRAEMNDAEARLKQAEAAFSPGAASGRVVAPMSGVITQLLVADGAHVAAGEPVAEFASDDRLTLHAEVTADSYAKLGQVTDARIGDYTLSEHGGQRSGISSENGYACIYFTFANDGTVLPGSGADVYLLGAPRQGVISLPLEAVTEQQGEHYVYRLHSPGHYEKIPVTLGASDGRRVEITSGLQGGEPIVSSGAMTVRLAESSAAIPEGHNHSH